MWCEWRVLHETNRSLVMLETPAPHCPPGSGLGAAHRLLLCWEGIPAPTAPQAQASGLHTGSSYAGRERPRRGWTSPDEALQQETQPFLNVRISDSYTWTLHQSLPHGATEPANWASDLPSQAGGRGIPSGLQTQGSAPLSSWRTRLPTHPQGSCACVSDQRCFLWLSGRKI